MRWDRLFAELEDSVRDEETLARDELAHEQTDAEWAALSSRELMWGDLALEVRGVGWLDGTVVHSLSDVLVVASLQGELAIARDAVMAWRGGSGRAPELSVVSRRLGWNHLARAIRDDGAEIRCTRIDGTAVSGFIGALGADALRLDPHVGEAVWIPWRAIAMVRLS